MKLSRLLQTLGVPLPSFADQEVEQITFHSGQVVTGGLFVAISGYASDGHQYIQEAITAGACMVVGEKPIDALQVPYIRVPNARLALAVLASELYGGPSQKHTMIGITGTNGKTTTSHLLRHVVEHAGETCSLFGTVECAMNGVAFPSKMTTHDAIQLQRWIRQSTDRNVIMEISSHGLAQHRVDGCLFDYAVFTNLTHEHLDYHKDMQQYYEAKARLFSLLKPGGEAIVNTAESWGRQLELDLSGNRSGSGSGSGAPVYTVGVRESDTIQLLHIERYSSPVVTIRESGVIRRLKLSIPGVHNVWNALIVLLVAMRKGIEFGVIADTLQTFPGVPGRFQIFQHHAGAYAVVDYAHTPDGLTHCLRTVHAYRPKRVVHIFGFRGGKDDSKWREMLKISNTYADETILTFDDLNGVPGEVMMQWYERLGHTGTRAVEDRTLAISEAWEQAGPGDYIIITGKGPEAYKQEFLLPARSDIETIEHLARSAKPVFS